MSVDVTGGRRPSLDFIVGEQPDNPDIRVSQSMWISDDQGRFGFPRLCVEAFASRWNHRGVEANIAFPDGRVLVESGAYTGRPSRMVDGQVMNFNAGPLTLEMIEPLKKWRLSYDGVAVESTVQRQMAGEHGGEKRRVQIELEADMAVPPWQPGQSGSGDDLFGDEHVTAKALGAVGGQRHEQLFRCRGRFELEGDKALDFTGTGLRINRLGVRDVGSFPGHCWQSALFPSGRAFGLMTFPAHADGAPGFGDSFIFDNGRMIKTRIVEAPWMNRFEPHGEPLDVVLETPDGQRACITGRSYDSTFIPPGHSMFGNWQMDKALASLEIPFHQGGARYTWDGESTYGMVERSLPGGTWN